MVKSQMFIAFDRFLVAFGASRSRSEVTWKWLQLQQLHEGPHNG